jgi:nicotinate phosphoribosyltransferase
MVDALLTDLYQITMAYAYWKSGRHNDESVFELFFRKNPFEGEFTVFAGLDDVLRFLNTFGYSADDCAALAERFPSWDAEFWVYLQSLTAKDLKLYAIKEGSVVFPRVPLLRVEGPIALCQLLETTLLVLCNYASLLTTNAARHRLAVGPHRTLLEFGMRRAQGPDGAMSASRYAYLGGFDGTSNVKAGLMFSLAMSGTHAHSFVAAFSSFAEVKCTTLEHATTGEKVEFVAKVLEYRSRLNRPNTNTGELAAFTAYAQAFPTAFLALVDTYDTLQSGLWNFLAVALALQELGYKPRGLRLDSGDLAYLSRRCRKAFVDVSEQFGVEFQSLTIVASNDLSEKILWALKEQGHEINSFGIGTNLVTCSVQPALGGVYKLVEVNGNARMKISQDHAKVTIPGSKAGYRLYNSAGEPVLDYMTHASAPAPETDVRVLCRHPFDANKRVYVTPSRVEPLHDLVWDGALTAPLECLDTRRARVAQQLGALRDDYLRRINPTPYKISLSPELFTYMHDLWLHESPIVELA